MYPYGEHMSGWGYALGIIGMVLFWAVLVLAIAASIRYLDRRRHETLPPPPSPPTAEQVLAERFAHGEIDADEYRQRLTCCARRSVRLPRGPDEVRDDGGQGCGCTPAITA